MLSRAAKLLISMEAGSFGYIQAEADVQRVFAFYEAERPGLGEEFLDRVDQAVLQIAHNPLAAVYSCAPRRLPYGETPKFKWDAQHFVDAIAEAEKMARLALQHTKLMDVEGWRQRTDDLKAEVEQRFGARAA